MSASSQHGSRRQAALRRGRWVVAGLAAGVLLIGGCEPDRGADTSSGVTAAPNEAGPPVASPSADATLPADTTPPPSEPADPGTPDFELTEEGRGSERIPLDLPETGLFIVTITYQATDDSEQSAFEITESDGRKASYPGVGDYSETYPLGFDPPSISRPESLSIDGEGQWTIHIQDLSEAPAWPEATEGDGSMVIRIEPGTIDGAVEVTAEHDGYFRADSYTYAGNPSGEDFLVPDELVVEFSPGTSQFAIPEETFAVAIGSDDQWTLDMP